MLQILVINTRKAQLHQPTQNQCFDDPEALGIEQTLETYYPLGQQYQRPPNGFTRPVLPTYRCPLDAIRDGWELIGPPIKDGFVGEDSLNMSGFAWWFIKEGKKGKK